MDIEKSIERTEISVSQNEIHLEGAPSFLVPQEVLKFIESEEIWGWLECKKEILPPEEILPRVLKVAEGSEFDTPASRKLLEQVGSFCYLAAVLYNATFQQIIQEYRYGENKRIKGPILTYIREKGWNMPQFEFSNIPQVHEKITDITAKIEIPNTLLNFLCKNEIYDEVVSVAHMFLCRPQNISWKEWAGAENKDLSWEKWSLRLQAAGATLQEIQALHGELEVLEASLVTIEDRWHYIDQLWEFGRDGYFAPCEGELVFNFPKPVAVFWWKNLERADLMWQEKCRDKKIELSWDELSTILSQPGRKPLEWGKIYELLCPAIWIARDEYEAKFHLAIDRQNENGDHQPLEYYYIWKVSIGQKGRTSSS